MIDVGEFGVQKLTRIYFYGKFNDNCLIGQTKCCVLISICFKCCLQTCNFDLIDVTKITVVVLPYYNHPLVLGICY